MKRSTPNNNAQNTKIPKKTSTQTSIDSIPQELLLIILKRLKKLDLKSAVKSGLAIKNAHNSLLVNAPKMKILLSMLLDYTTKDLSTENNTSHFMISNFEISALKKDKTSFTITYDSTYNFDFNNSQDYMNDKISVSRIKMLIDIAGFHEAQFQEIEDNYQDILRDSVIQEYAEQYANWLNGVTSFRIDELKLENFKENVKNNSSKTNNVGRQISSEIQRVLNNVP